MINMFYKNACVSVIFLVCAHALEDIVSVVTSVGTVRGRKTRGRESFIQFLGVPYADVDENDPFAPAKPYPHFSTPYSAFNDPPVCPQAPVTGKFVDPPKGNIHCLNLNIYTPNNATANSSLPVMVYIHGGIYIKGNANVGTYSPKFLVRNNVIVVTINYRLGAYGFICVPDLGYSNQGLHDMILGLKWIKTNIKSFGGDEENILIFGSSSGSQSVDYLLLYNEDNVFNKVILQSGVVVSPYFMKPPADESYVISLAQRLGINTKNLKTKDIIKQLSNVNSHLLVNVTKFDQFNPCVDNILITNILKRVDMSNKKIIIGTTTKDMSYFHWGDNTSNIDLIQKDLKTGFNYLPADAVNAIKNFYLTEDDRDKVDDFGTDFAFNYPAERTIRFYLSNHATLYRYVYSYTGGRDFGKTKANLTAKSATHSDELGYIFDMDIYTDEITPEDNVVINVLSTMWTNFAKYGNPTPQLTDEITTLWPAVDKDSRRYLHINLSLSVEDGPYERRMMFWDKFYETYGKYSKGINFGEECMRSKANKCDFSLNVLLLLLIMLKKQFT